MAEARDGAVRRALRTLGHERLRPGQREALDAVLGGRDALVILPTGHGKSLVYQAAALVLDGPVVVVSPLIALMRDQVAGLEEAGVDAVRIDGTRGARARERDLRRLASGEAPIAYATPEQLEDEALTGRLAAARPSLVAVDEAHVLSRWGRGFRPAYLRIADAIERLGRPPVIALTATADPWVRREIGEALALREPAEIVRGTGRDNLFLEVVRAERPADERRELGRLLAGPDAEPGGRGIVYVRTTRAARETAAWLRERGVAAEHYHGRRRAGDRERVERGFADGSIPVVVATNAFGLGIDVPDVRFVVHRHVPASLDAYHQEAGRAGRDGEPARCTLIYRPDALGQAAFLAATGSVGRDDLAAVGGALDAGEPATEAELRRRSGLGAARLRRAVDVLAGAGVVERRRRRVRRTRPFDPAEVPLDAEERRAAYEASRLDMMRGYAETDGCRRRFILNYFGEEPGRPRCGMCDNDRDHPHAPPEDAPAGLPAELAVGARVRHPAFGRGTVSRVEADRLTVAFDDEGYRTLDAAAVLDDGLLEPA